MVSVARLEELLGESERSVTGDYFVAGHAAFVGLAIQHDAHRRKAFLGITFQTNSPEPGPGFVQDCPPFWVKVMTNTPAKSSITSPGESRLG